MNGSSYLLNLFPILAGVAFFAAARSLTSSRRILIHDAVQDVPALSTRREAASPKLHAENVLAYMRDSMLVKGITPDSGDVRSHAYSELGLLDIETPPLTVSCAAPRQIELIIGDINKAEAQICRFERRSGNLLLFLLDNRMEVRLL